ncbi:MAG: winged helix DNA-binding domain-containing protein [Dehalococcoidia bacterium]
MIPRTKNIEDRDIAQRRLQSQHIAQTPCTKPGDVVEWLGAAQAQDYLGALWAIGLRMQEATETEIEQAIADKTIIRTWPMRGTLHFVPAADVRWMLDLMTPRILAGSVRRFKQLELDDAQLMRSEALFIQALQGGKQLSRPAMFALLEAADISTAGQRGYHILWRLAQEGLLCLGTREGKQPTFALLDEWVPTARRLQREEALAELVRRYFIGHGPATMHDFMWWSGLTAADAFAGIGMVKSLLVQKTSDGRAYWMSGEQQTVTRSSPSMYLLPGFDEYLLGYKDRTAVLGTGDSQRVNPGNNGMFSPTIVLDGRVVGTWKRVLKKDRVVVTAYPFATLSDTEDEAFTVAASRYGKFLDLPATSS